jgi:hypothetical protein
LISLSIYPNSVKVGTRLVPIESKELSPFEELRMLDPLLPPTLKTKVSSSEKPLEMVNPTM